MKLYDDMIARCREMLNPFSSSCKRYSFSQRMDVISEEKSDYTTDLWEQEDEQRILFKKDMAYELGGDNLPAYSGVAFTSDKDVKDEIVVCGPDLQQLSGNSPYARLTILRVNDEAWTDKEQAYRILRRLDYTRYHVYPKGFLMRISAAAHREPVRISREALRKGLNFERAGRLFINAYHKHPEVLGVRLVFITDPDFPYEKFGEAVRTMDSITESMNEIFNNLVMDCAACRLKPVCDEVEGLRELHFSADRSGRLIP